MVVEKYKNMINQKMWVQTDSRDVKFIAFTTKLEVLDTQLKSNPYVHDTNVNEGNFNIFPWSMKNIGHSITVDDKM